MGEQSALILRSCWQQYFGLFIAIKLIIAALSVRNCSVSTDKEEFSPLLSNAVIDYFWLKNWETAGVWSVHSSSTDAFGNCINVSFVLISIWLSVSAVFPGSSRATWSSGPCWTKRSTGKSYLQTCTQCVQNLCLIYVSMLSPTQLRRYSNVITLHVLICIKQKKSLRFNFI